VEVALWTSKLLARRMCLSAGLRHRTDSTQACLCRTRRSGLQRSKLGMPRMTPDEFESCALGTRCIASLIAQRPPTKKRRTGVHGPPESSTWWQSSKPKTCSIAWTKSTLELEKARRHRPEPQNRPSKSIDWQLTPVLKPSRRQLLTECARKAQPASLWLFENTSPTCCAGES
jgi:hypothetical protein